MTHIVAAWVSPGEMLIGADRRLCGRTANTAPKEDVAKLFGFGDAPDHSVVAVHGEFQVIDVYAHENISGWLAGAVHTFGGRPGPAIEVAAWLRDGLRACLAPAKYESCGELLIFGWQDAEPRFLRFRVRQAPNSKPEFELAAAPHRLTVGYAFWWGVQNGPDAVPASPYLTADAMRDEMAKYGQSLQAGRLCSERPENIDVFSLTPTSLSQIARPEY